MVDVGLRAWDLCLITFKSCSVSPYFYVRNQEDKIKYIYAYSYMVGLDGDCLEEKLMEGSGSHIGLTGRDGEESREESDFQWLGVWLSSTDLP